MTVQFKPKTGGRGIEWTDETRNPIGGCQHRCRWQMPDGTVAECYALTIAEEGVAASAYPHGFGHHYWRPNDVKVVHRGREPFLIFVDSMSDLFAAYVPKEQIRSILAAMRKGPHHAYQSLTKAAPQVLKYVDLLPPNLWVGVSSPPDWMHGHRLDADKQRSMLHRSLDVLKEVKERTDNLVWMSAEPISWDLTSVLDVRHPLDWIVVGAASSGRRQFQPDKENVRRLLDLMDKTKTPVFFKGNIAPLMGQKPFDNDRLDRWREDFPHTYRDGEVIPAVERRQQRCVTFSWPLSQASGAAPLGALPSGAQQVMGVPRRKSVKQRLAGVRAAATRYRWSEERRLAREKEITDSAGVHDDSPRPGGEDATDTHSTSGAPCECGRVLHLLDAAAHSVKIHTEADAQRLREIIRNLNEGLSEHGGCSREG